METKMTNKKVSKPYIITSKVPAGKIQVTVIRSDKGILTISGPNGLETYRLRGISRISNKDMINFQSRGILRSDIMRFDEVPKDYILYDIITSEKVKSTFPYEKVKKMLQM